LQERNPNKKNPLWVLGAIGAFLLTQAKLILPLLKFGKLGGAIVSMFITVGAYALIAPWSFAIGLVLMILIHEMGHVLAAKRKGLPVTAPVFIPFMGALITLKKHPADAVTEAYIALGGPMLGTLGAVIAYAIGVQYDSPLLISISYIGFYLNLLNLLPIHPLDGGRISTAVTRWLWVVGLLGGLVIIIYLKSIIFMIIWAMFAYDLYKKFVKFRHKAEVIKLTPKFDFPAEHLVQQGFLLPGEQHRRDLDFTTYSHLQGDNDGAQTIEMKWEGIGFQARIQLPRQVLIKKVQVAGIERVNQADGLHLGIFVEIDCTPFENDRYYEVPAATRWKYGAAYFGLALFLLYMIGQVHKLKLIGL
jgi:Zn-dependent protease